MAARWQQDGSKMAARWQRLCVDAAAQALFQSTSHRIRNDVIFVIMVTLNAYLLSLNHCPISWLVTSVDHMLVPLRRKPAFFYQSLRSASCSVRLILVDLPAVASSMMPTTSVIRRSDANQMRLRRRLRRLRCWNTCWLFHSNCLRFAIAFLLANSQRRDPSMVSWSL